MNEWTNEKVEDDFTKGALVISPITPRSLTRYYLLLAGCDITAQNEWMNEWMNEWTNEKVEDDFTKGALVISPITPRSLARYYLLLAGCDITAQNEWMNE